MAELNLISPTAEIPVMPVEVARLVARLDRGDCMAAIFTEMATGLANCIEDNKWLEEHSHGMWELFHSMSRPFLRCVFTKTLGPDLYDKDNLGRKNWEDVFDIDGPDAYAMFSVIRDRKGRWLSGNEIKTLVSLIEDYRAAVDVCIRRRGDDAYGSIQLTREGERVLGQAMKIDDAKRTNKQDMTLDDLDRFNPRFESRSTGSGFITQLIAMLKRRCLPHLDQEAWQCQSPLMVGNSGNMKEHTADHFLDKSLTKTPKIWGLMLSCICVMGLQYEVQAVPLFRAWIDARQVNMAEVLGSVLTGSLVSVAGMNVRQPGTREEDNRADASDYLSSKHLVFAKAWFRENLELSLRDRDANKETQKQLDAANAKLERVEEAVLLEEEKALKEELQNKLEKLLQVNETLRKNVEADEKALAAGEKKARAIEKFFAARDKAKAEKEKDKDKDE